MTELQDAQAAALRAFPTAASAAVEVLTAVLYDSEGPHIRVQGSLSWELVNGATKHRKLHNHIGQNVLVARDANYRIIAVLGYVGD